MPQDPTSRFLTTLFGDVPDTLRFLIWTMPDKVSRWYRPVSDLDRAVTEIAALDEHDVYVGVGLSPRDRGARQRVTAKDVAGVVGLWADLDFADEAHKKDNLPPDEAAAIELSKSMGVDPTLTVHSGHGLQAWWLFDEPWIFATPAERAAAAALATRWHLTLRVHAAERGWVIDATQDLSRVLRVPGTINRKAEPVPVRLLLGSSAKRRYGRDDLGEYLADDSALGTLTGRRTYTAADGLELNPTAQPNIDKLDALRSNDTKFRQSWDRTRKDLADQSGSSYDLSLASIAAAVGWSDQEIVDLLIASRRKHGDDLKLRLDYYQRTLSRARDDEARTASTEQIETAQAQVERAEALGDSRGVNRARVVLLDHLSTALGVAITRFIRFTQDPPRYRVETTAGGVTLGTAEVILSQAKMRAAIAGATKIVIARFKSAKWDEVAQAIFSACEDEDTGIESTDEGVAYAWLTEYLTDRPILDERDTAAETLTPFREGDLVYIFGTSFRRWLNLGRGDRVSPNRMGEILRAFGCEHVVVNVTLEGRRTSRSVWKVPGLEDALDRARHDRAARSEADAKPKPKEKADG